MARKILFPSQLVLLSRQLSYLVNLSVPIPDAVRQLEQSSPDKELARVLRKVVVDLEEGKSLAGSVVPHAPPLVSRLIAFGEQRDQLAFALKEISAHYESEEALNREIRVLLLYPSILLFGAVLCAGMLFIFFWGQFAHLFLEFELPPWLSVFLRFMLWASRLWVGVAALGILVGLMLFLWHKGWLRQLLLFPALLWPDLKRLYVKTRQVKVYRALSLLLRLNHPLPEVLASVRGLISDRAIRDDLRQVEEAVSRGKPLEIALNESRWFKRSLLGKTTPSGRSGELSDMIAWTAESLEQEILSTSRMFLTLVEPVALCAVGSLLFLVMWLFWFPFYQAIMRIPAP